MSIQETNKLSTAKESIEARGLSMQQLIAAKQLLLEGNSPTGDDLYDGVVGFYGDDQGEYSNAVAIYENIQANLKGKIKQPIILISRYSTTSSLLDSEAKNIRREISLGIIDSEKVSFDFDHRSIFIGARPVIISTKPRLDSDSFFFPYDDRDESAENPTAQIKLRTESSRDKTISSDFGVGLNNYQDSAYNALNTFPNETLLIGNEQIDEWLANVAGDHEASQVVELFDMFKSTYNQLPQSAYLAELLWAATNQNS
jgi:hypothetical protein